MPFEVPFLYWITLLGAAGSYIIQKNKKRIPFSVLRAFNLDTGKNAPAWLLLVDVAVTSLFGSLLVFLFTEPTTKQQAVVIGIGFTGIIAMVEKGGNDGDAA
jgi:hypothetical protein